MPPLPRRLVWALALLALLLTATVVPGVFTIDEDHYLATLLALREGRLTVPGTEGLTPSRSLLWFDPEARGRRVESTPVAPTAPPLYAPVALPFSLLGWRGLVALQTLAWMAAALLVAGYAARYAREAPAVPWLAAGAFALGGYSIEYAQGLWPHMLSILLVVGAAALAARVRDGGAPWLAFAAGLAAGLAAGVRYQNAVVAVLIGAGIFLWTDRRWTRSAAYAGGLALPLAASSLINHARLGSWNPISKGPRYLDLGLGRREGSLLADTATMAWARVVDFSARPPLTGTEHAQYLRPDPVTGAFLVGPAMKKAWLQSSPWLALALVVMLLAWTRRGGAARDRELRALSLVVFPMLLVFALAGVTRTDGLGFNQRYLLDLVPLAAVALAWAVADLRLGRRGVLLGLAAGGLAAAAALVPPPWHPARQLALLYLPLAFALTLLAAWAAARRRGGSRALGPALGLCLGWALAVHLGDDLRTSRALRGRHLEQAAALAREVPDGSAIFAYAGTKDAAGPLQLDRDLVVVDVRYDDGEAAPALAAEMAARGRRVFVLADGFPQPVFEAMAAGRPVRGVMRRPLTVLEVLPPGERDNVPSPAGGRQAPAPTAAPHQEPR